MKVLTLNTWQEKGPWQARWEVIAGGLAQFQSDIVGLQEVFNPDWLKDAAHKADYPFLIHPEPVSGLAILSRYRVLEWAVLTMITKAPSEPYLRYAIFARLHLPGRGNLSVFNTHLSWRPGESAIRHKQVGELLQFIREKAGNDETLVMGDFNAVADTPEIKMMTGEGHFKDSYAGMQPNQPGLTWDNQNPYAKLSSSRLPDRRIDYLFFRNASDILSRLNSVEIVYREPNAQGVFASDHYGLLAEFGES